nr:putative phage minor tail protein [uncultured Mediterranean phage uvMED]
MTSFAFGHALRIKPDQTELYRFQNFFIGKEITHSGSGYQFVPFGFSGVTVNRTGDGLEATLVFPNNDLSRAWGVSAIENSWLMEIDVLIIEDPDPDTGLAATNTIVHTYTGQVTGGQWDNTSLNLELSSVLDAVGTDVPRRSLTKRTVGNLPISNNVRLQ